MSYILNAEDMERIGNKLAQVLRLKQSVNDPDKYVTQLGYADATEITNLAMDIIEGKGE
jgi:hypothetical protein